MLPLQRPRKIIPSHGILSKGWTEHTLDSIQPFEDNGLKDYPSNSI
jgi:hypothetical protein